MFIYAVQRIVKCLLPVAILRYVTTNQSVRVVEIMFMVMRKPPIIEGELLDGITHTKETVK